MLIKELEDKGKIHPPSWLAMNTVYLTIMGSMAYGTSSDISDMDVYGVTIPPLTSLFPHLAGEIPDFGKQKQRFGVWQQHHIMDEDALGGKGREYDFTVYGISKFFHLCMENNPSCLDSLFVPANCILHMTSVGTLIRENRHKFLHKGIFHKLKGYSFSQLHKMTIKNPEGKRKADIEKHGFDTKFGMHVVRLLGQCEQVLLTGDLDLQKNREHLKAIRRGEVSEEEIRKWAASKEADLEKLYVESKLPHSPDEESIKSLLLCCLEQHYGSLDKVVAKPQRSEECLRKIKGVLEDYGI